LDDLCLARLGLARDEGGALAATGAPDMDVVTAFLQEPYFFRIPPKSLDRDFPGLAARVAHLADADALATLAECVAASVAAGFDHLPQGRLRKCWCVGAGAIIVILWRGWRPICLARLRRSRKRQGLTAI
jgi:anhydro-N-acetylmuramic acid kinase